MSKKTTPINDNIFIDFNIIKDLVEDIVLKTPGVAEVNGLLSKTITQSNNSHRVIDIEQDENGSIHIKFSIGINNPYLLLNTPISLQKNLYNAIKYTFNIESKIHVYVSKLVSK